MGQNRGGFEFQTGGILRYVEDLELGSNKEFGPKDFFEMACNTSAVLLKKKTRQVFR